MLKSICFIILTFFLIDAGQAQCLTIGGDLSYVNSVLANGGVFRDTNENIIDPYIHFADRGANMVRIRLWHTPENIIDHCGNPITTNNLEDVVLAFQRAKAQGMQLKLAFHYGDYFNDPGRQKMPMAWEGVSHQTLIDSIYNYTFSVLERLESEGVRPDIVAIGNETTWGFIDESSTTDGWTWPEDADKFNTGLLAVDDFNNAQNATIKKALHFTDNTAIWLTELFASQNITNFDIIGISFYPVFTEFTSLQNLGNVIQELKNSSGKEIMIFETGAPWTTGNADNYSNFINNYGNLDYPVSAEGQKDYLFDLASIVYENGGSGLLYWEPGWISSEMCDFWGQGSSYENVSFYDFNAGNAPLPAFDIFNFCDNFQSTETIHVDGALSVFPNPTKGEIFISGLDKLTEIRVTDSMGQVVGEFLSNDKIDMGSLHHGIYFIHIGLDDKWITRQVILE